LSYTLNRLDIASKSLINVILIKQTFPTELLKRLITASVLAYPSQEETFVLDADAIQFGIEAVLSQIHNEVVIGYYSNSLRNFATRKNFWQL